MTRCLDCGSERTGDQCAVCGLTSAAAEVVFRRRLLTQLAFFLAGSLLFPYVSQLYAPLDIDAMLVFFGVVFFSGLFLAFYLDRGAHARRDIEVLRHLFTGLIPVPFIFTAVLFLNGRLDSRQHVVYHPTVVDSRYQMTGIVRGTRRIFVGSWRPGRRFERLAVDSDDFDRFHEGDRIIVGVEPGALGIPWFYGVYRQGTPSSSDPPPQPAPQYLNRN